LVQLALLLQSPQLLPHSMLLLLQQRLRELHSRTCCCSWGRHSTELLMLVLCEQLPS
jgi:hypothetical protein